MGKIQSKVIPIKKLLNENNLKYKDFQIEEKLILNVSDLENSNYFFSKKTI